MFSKHKQFLLPADTELYFSLGVLFHLSDIFFIIISVLQGGIFRGWLAKKEPKQT